MSPEADSTPQAVTTSSDLETTIVERFKNRWRDLLRGMVNSELRIDPPLLADEKLASKISTHNAKVEKFTAAIDKLGTAAGDIASLLSDPSLVGAEVAKRAQRIHEQRYDLLQQLLGILGSKVAIFSGAKEFLRTEVESAEKALAEARAQIRDNLIQMGITPQSILGSVEKYGANPRAAEIVFEHRVNEAEKVKVLTARLQNASMKLERARRERNGIAADATKVGQELQAAWRELVGQL